MKQGNLTRAPHVDAFGRSDGGIRIVYQGRKNVNVLLNSHNTATTSNEHPMYLTHKHYK
jgi:hypothetical protein